MVFHQDRLAPGRAGSLSPLTAQKIWRTTLWIWIYCNPLKTHKTTKTFLGKAWHWNRISLEKLAKSLEARDRAGRSYRLQAMTAPIDSIISPRLLRMGRGEGRRARLRQFWRDGAADGVALKIIYAPFGQQLRRFHVLDPFSDGLDLEMARERGERADEKAIVQRTG